MKTAYLALLIMAFTLGCTAEQWETTKTKTEKVKERTQAVIEVVKVLPLPPEVKEPATGILRGVVAILGAVAAFSTWRKRVADRKADLKEKAFDAVSEAVDNSDADLSGVLKTAAEKHLGSVAALKVQHHESVIRRG